MFVDQSNLFDMNTFLKDQYISPVCEMLELSEEGVICVSPPDFGDGGTYQI